jgi:hypothetical protein
MRYDNTIILKDEETNKRYFGSLKYPSIPYTDNDFYIITVHGDRLDLLADNYYGSIDYYWILSYANNIKNGSIFIPPGTQLRIPGNLSDILDSFYALNNP